MSTTTPRRARRPRRRTVVAAALGLALLAGAAVAAWEWRHPEAFPDHSGSISMTARWPVGEALYVGVTYGGDGAAVEVHDAEPVVRRNDAGATLEHVLCTPREPAGGGIGSADEAFVQRHCASLEPIGERDLRHDGSGDRQVLLRVEPTREGVLVVAGTDLTYSAGWRTGTQRVGEGVRLRAVTRPAP